MEINLIVAISKNYCIGKNGGLVFNIKNDLKRFKALTENNVVVMGSKTFESLPNGALPNRTNIVITNDKNYKVNDKSVLVVNSIEEAVLLYKSWFYREDGVLPCKKFFVIGGGTIYKQFLEKNLVDVMHITRIDEDVEDGETFFPKFNTDEWELTEVEPHIEDKKYFFETWQKKLKKVC